ncbi:site-specific integrase [bacterium]|nr:site-specific integrase [bacterium]
MANRRKNGEGCFSRNGNGFDYRITYIDNSGKSKYKYFWAKTKAECIEKATIWRNEQNGIYTKDANSNWTIEQWANYWYDNYVVGKVKITTQSDDKSILDHHIIKDIGQYRLKNITGQMLQRFYNACSNKTNSKGENLSPKTIKNIYTVANRMFKCAYNNDLISFNPNKKVELPKREKKFANALTAEDAEKLAQSCIKCGSTMDLLIIFLLCTGVRLGEALGLQWSKVNLFKKEIRIDQQVQAIPNTDKNSKHKYKLEIIKSTKTRYSNRTLPILKELSTLLYTIKQKQIENQTLNKNNYRYDLDLVFAKDDGYFICDTVFRKYLNSKLDTLGIEHFRIHDLRHSYATRLFESGQYEPKTVSQLLGHSSIGITLDTYTHVMPTKLRNEVNKSAYIFRRYFNNIEKDIPDEMFPKKLNEKEA